MQNRGGAELGIGNWHQQPGVPGGGNEGKYASSRKPVGWPRARGEYVHVSWQKVSSRWVSRSPDKASIMAVTDVAM